MNLDKVNLADVFRWSWNEETRKALKDKDEAGTLYWCCSRICIYRNDDKFWDTYWGDTTGDSNKRFSIDQAREKLTLEFVGNLNDLVQKEPTARAYYLDRDCVDLNHPNRTKGNFYLRKGAEKSIEKMKRVMGRRLEECRISANYYLDCVIEAESGLNNLTIDSIVPISGETDLYD